MIQEGYWDRYDDVYDPLVDDVSDEDEEDYKSLNNLWSRPLVTTYQRARRVIFLRTRICNSPLLTRAFFAVEGPVERVIWEVQHRYLLHTLKGIALEDYRVYVEDYEHWMSGSWESYMEERGYR